MNRTKNHEHTFAKPPENKAKEKSARWLINWNLKEALPVLAYCELDSWFANLYWNNKLNVHRSEKYNQNCVVIVILIW